MINNTFGILDGDHIGVLTLLDLSAAFDIVDHTNLHDVKPIRFGILDRTLQWQFIFPSDGSRSVVITLSDSGDVPLLCSISEEFVLSTKLFLEYIDVVGLLQEGASILRVCTRHAEFPAR